MQSTTQPAAPASERPAMHPISCHCPHCGSGEANVAVLLGQLDCEQFRCEDCSTEFSIESLEEIIGHWQKVIAWVKAAPQHDAE